VSTLVVVASISLGGCATTSRKPWVLGTEELSARPVRDIELVSTYPQALATTLDVMRRDLGLPPVHAELLFVPDTRSMRDLLLGAGSPPRLARQAAREMIAIGGHGIVLVNQARLENEDWSGRVSLLAHELGHVLQYELGGGTRGASAQWLREGFSKWLEFRVMEALGRAERDKEWTQALERVRNPARVIVMTHGGTLRERAIEREPRIRMPALDSLHSFPEWLEQLDGDAGGALYEYAFIAVTTLVEEQGLPTVLRYFELFASRQDLEANFLEAFGQSEEQFEKHLRDVVWQ